MTVDRSIVLTNPMHNIVHNLIFPASKLNVIVIVIIVVGVGVDVVAP